MRRAVSGIALALAWFGAAPSMAGEEAMIGQFRGCMEWGGRMTPVETEIGMGESGLFGRYSIAGPDGGITAGTLEPDGYDDDLRIVFIWADRQSKGRAYFEPGSDRTGFFGAWSYDGDAVERVWWGRKNFTTTTALQGFPCGG